MQNVSHIFINVITLKILCHKAKIRPRISLPSHRTKKKEVLLMIITKFETWWVERGRCLFDEKRQGGAKMGWDVIAIKLTTDTGIEGVATCMAARSGAVSEAYLQESIGPVVLGRDPHDREAIFQELWTIDRHEAFFPVFLPGPVDVALWDICAKEAGLPLYKYIGACRDSLPVYASGNFHGTVKEYVDEALYYQSKGIPGYKAHPGGPVSFDMEVHQAIRDAVGPDYLLMSDPVGDYTLNEAVTVGRQLEKLNYKWFEEPFRDFELYKYTELCRVLDIPLPPPRPPAVATGAWRRSSPSTPPTSSARMSAGRTASPAH